MSKKGEPPTKTQILRDDHGIIKDFWWYGDMLAIRQIRFIGNDGKIEKEVKIIRLTKKEAEMITSSVHEKR